MSLVLANRYVADLSNEDLAKHARFVRAELAYRCMTEGDVYGQRRDLDELEPRRTWPSRDTVPAPHNPEDDAG